ncbi:MAG: molybdopterin-dependent oxidoreductase [Vicinamibacterales bacterium]|jgi:DMSO/TMAO reductase YedYZ molybdopterin-dependent catalytic subunit|nr:molybdopterin-dependent oxidoreductase [Vicinamibacterales bacterium]
MKISRRQAIRASGTALTGLTLGLTQQRLLARPGLATQPQQLEDAEYRDISDLGLLPDGSAPEHPLSAREDISSVIYRFGQPRNTPPDIDYDYRNLSVTINGGGTTSRTGTMRWSDLEPLPRREHVFLLQCGAPSGPRGIVKWTGVRFSDVAEMLGVAPFARYARFVSADGYWVDEDMTTLMHPQVLLTWMLNDEPIPPGHGAPLRLVIPFRWGARSAKALTHILLTSTSFPQREPLQIAL